MFRDKPVDPREAGKEARRDMRGSERELERELRALDRAERQAVQEAKTFARRGEADNARLMARQVVQIRQTRDRLHRSKATLRTASLATHQAQAQAAQVKAMQTAGTAMHKANSQLSPAQMQQVMAQFAKQSDKSAMSMEMMDDLFDDGSVEEEADAEVMKIFDELGAETLTRMADAPQRQISASASQEADSAAEDDVLQKLGAL